MKTSSAFSRMFVPTVTRLFALLLVLVGPLSSHAQSPTGQIAGRVANESTGAYLEGAAVFIENLRRSTLTDRNGTFTFEALPPGSHTISVRYTGFPPKTQTLTVDSGATAQVEFMLGSDIVELEAFTITATKEGNAVSITRQRNTPNVVNVVSLDAYGNVADSNLGNFMEKLPGVATFTAEGDITGVILRGSPPNQSMVAVDGTRLAAAVAGSGAAQGDRAPAIDRIPSEFIKEIEVNKAFIPDMPTDGLGGSANLVTKSAFDFRNRIVTYRAAMVHNSYRGDRFTPSSAFTLMDTVGAERKIGLTLTGSYTETVNTRDRMETTFNELDRRQTLARLLDDTYTRVRAGTGLKLEYRPDADTGVYANAMYSYYSSDTERQNSQSNDTATRRVADYSVVSRAAIEAGAVPRTSSGQTASVAPGYTDTFTEMLNASFVQQGAIEVRRNKQYNYAVGGRKKWGETEITGKLTYNPSRYINNFQGITTTLAGIGMAIDSSRDPERPTFTQTYGRTSILAGSDFTQRTAQIFQQPRLTEEEITSGQVDVKHDFQARFPLMLKAGLNYREQHRTTFAYNPTWNYVGADGVAGRNSSNGVNDDNLAQFVSGRSYGLFNGQYPAHDRLDYAAARALLSASPNLFLPVGTSTTNIPPPNDITEEVTAAYLMGRARIANLEIVSGVRMEETQVDAVASFADPRQPDVTTNRKEGGYRNYFPSVHFRFEPRRGLVLRASYSTSMSRPSIEQITPVTTISHNDATGLGVVNQRNPGLEPQYSENYDLSAEYYFEPVGVLSVSLFRKDIEDFIFSTVDIIEPGSNNGFNGNYAGYELRTSGNFGNAQIEGYELNYNQRMHFLPRPFNGLSIFANYTEIATEGTYDGNQTELANFYPKTANLGFNWAVRNWEFGASWNYKSAALIVFNANPLSERRANFERKVDLSLKYRYRPWLVGYIDVANVFNYSPYNYRVSPDRILFSEMFGTRWTVGISGRF